MYNATVIKTMCLSGWVDPYINGTTKSQELGPHKYTSLISDKGTQYLNVERTAFSAKSGGAIRHLQAKKEEQEEEQEGEEQTDEQEQEQGEQGEEAEKKEREEEKQKEKKRKSLQQPPSSHKNFNMHHRLKCKT